jgi:predicted DNA-binding transcriptional regulator YafY
MPRGDQINRHWKILRMLEHRKEGMTTSEIHERLGFDVDERTIQRDLEHLEPIFQLVKEGRRWRAPKQTIQSEPLSSTELMALLLSESLLHPIENSDLAETLRDLRQKVEASLSPKCLEYAFQAKRYLATFSAPAQLPRENENVKLIEDAIHKEQRLNLKYWSPKSGYQDRRVDPYSLWFVDGRLYLIAWCHLRSDFRTFHVGRVRDAEILDEVFERDPNFEAQRYVAGGFGVWQGEEYEIKLLFERDVAHLPAERVLHPSQKCHAPLSNGSVLVTFKAKGLPEIASWVAGFGGLVRVMQPEVLIGMVREIHQRGLARYEDAASAIAS